MRTKYFSFSFLFCVLMLTSMTAPMPVQGSNDIKVSSTTFENNTSLPSEQAHTRCGGDNISPDLYWDHIPSEAKSFALIMHDPDAPRADGFYHWLVIDIPVSKKSLDRGEKIVNAKELKNDFQEVGYGGPCPPVGEHRYRFTIYALDTDQLNILSTDSPKQIEQKIKKHTIAQGTLTGLYQQ